MDLGFLLGYTIKFKNEEVLKKYLNMKGEFDFKKIIPIPKTKETLIKKYGKKYLKSENEVLRKNYNDKTLNDDLIFDNDDNYPKWLNWVKWDKDFWGCESNAEFRLTMIRRKSCSFDIRNGDPIRIFQKICSQNPNEKIDFYGDFCNQWGYENIKTGKYIPNLRPYHWFNFNGKLVYEEPIIRDEDVRMCQF